MQNPLKELLMPAHLRLLLALCLLSAGPAVAHDTWVETHTNLIRAGDAVHIDLKLGNHGNDHRDFKLASKITLDGCTLDLIAPSGQRYDLESNLSDLGYAPTDGYWSARFTGVEPGLYCVAHSLDKVVNHGRPVRSIKSGKTFFVVSPSLDRVSQENPGYDKPLGHPLEIVPVVNPVTPMGPGQPISVRLLHNGRPLANARVSFIPRGHTLQEGFDPEHERTTNEKGEASFTPRSGNVYLVVAHRHADDESGDDYEATLYSATLTVFVPQICPCCGE
jgi:uncharacterized GH25 family protein